MSQRKGQAIKMSKKAYDSELNKAYLDGYKTGYDAGVQDERTKHITLNQSRIDLGLPPIHNTLKTEV